MQHTGFYVDLLEVHDALNAVRKSVDSDYTDSEWTPALPGDKLPLRVKPAGKVELSELMWPSLPYQLIPREGENVSLKYARIGDILYAPMYIEIFQKLLSLFMIYLEECCHPICLGEYHTLFHQME